ncbi:MAG: hypothetical protein J5662_02355 [Clostridia bacterium]|nr:hypothetical protein [Clostridia bacterium]
MRKSIFILIFGFLIITTAVFLSLKSCQSNFKFYQGISDTWIELECYHAKPQKYLGKYPEDIFCDVYSLKGISKESLLYLDGSDMIGFGSSRYTKILMDANIEEPIKSFSIKQILIKEYDDSTIKITDKAVLSRVEQVLKKQPTDICDFSFERFNSSVYLDVECGLNWTCAFEKQGDTYAYLIGFDQKKNQFVYYDVANILKDF